VPPLRLLTAPAPGLSRTLPQLGEQAFESLDVSFEPVAPRVHLAA
jgi:hypothetical protein